MPLSLIVIDETAVSPRGGRAGTTVSVPGSGFGAPTGVVRFDPLGENLVAAIVSWAPSLVVFTVPTLSATNRSVTVQIENSTADDMATMPFWYPSTPAVAPGYQWPNAEAGSVEQDVDDPRISSAADFNRALDLAGAEPFGTGTITTIAATGPLGEAVALALVDASAGPVMVTLPLAAVTGRRRRIIKKIDATANAVTVARNGANIEGVAADQVLTTALQTIELVADGSGWWVIGRV
jgi:hypothetical protein